MPRVGSSGSGGASSSNPIIPVKSVYNEITNVPIGVGTSIVSYMIVDAIAYLSGVTASGQNIGDIEVYKNLNIIDKQYLYYTGFNLEFNFKNLSLVMGDIINIKCLNRGQDTCSFNARIEIVGN